MAMLYYDYSDGKKILSLIQSLPKLLTFDEFIEWLPENRRYELHDGIIIKMQPRGKDEDIAGFLTQELTFYNIIFVGI